MLGKALIDLLEEETTSSTSYKARLIGDHILRHLLEHRENAATSGSSSSGPLMVAMQGPQGCGGSPVFLFGASYCAGVLI
jgi:hypothetical protein